LRTTLALILTRRLGARPAWLTDAALVVAGSLLVATFVRAWERR
jgi:hypothetical protein